MKAAKNGQFCPACIIYHVQIQTSSPNSNEIKYTLPWLWQLFCSLCEHAHNGSLLGLSDFLMGRA